MSIRSFVTERVTAMGTRPQMWARSKEAFGLQLVLLAEIALYEHPTQRTNPSGFGPTVELMRKLFGPGNAIPNEECDEAWSKKSADATLEFIEECIHEATTPS